jgi:radical SAM protein with 4Fe4S-binding SPASM domain
MNSLPRKWLFKYLWHRCNRAYRDGAGVVPCGPRELWIEPTNYCNLKCVMCPHGKGIRVKQGYMELELYSKIIGELSSLRVQRINLFLGGESLLHKSLPDMLHMAGKAKMGVRLHTNATLLSEALSETILDSGSLEEISFSFDGETREYYERIRVHAIYERTLQNIVAFLKVKARLGLKNPRVLIQLIREHGQSAFPEALDAFKALFKGLPVDKFQVIPFHNFAGTLDAAGGGPCPEKKKHVYRPCRHPWRSMSVAWDGEVVGCCVDMDKKLVLGDLKTQSVAEVWNGEPMRSFRKALAEGRYAQIDLCRDCDQLWI